MLILNCAKFRMGSLPMSDGRCGSLMECKVDFTSTLTGAGTGGGGGRGIHNMTDTNCLLKANTYKKMWKEHTFP